MIVGSSLRIEIGDRVLLDEGSFVVGEGEKVGIVGRNGVGKSSLMSVLIGDAPRQVRHSGNVAITGSMGFLPQMPVPEGLGLDPSGFSHVLSSRGLDVLDDALDKARKQMAKDPSNENIVLYSDLEEQYREQGGYEAESVMARLADGLGLRQDLLFEDLGSLSGGQRRRVDIIRVLFQTPQIMVLDEPTNHLDLAAKRWLLDELERFKGTLLLISHDLRLLDRSITKVLYFADKRILEFKGNHTSFRQQLTARQAQTERAAQLESKEIERLSTLADSMRGQTERRARVAKSLDKRVSRLESSRTTVQRRERQRDFKLPIPPRAGAVPLSVKLLAVRYDRLQVLKKITFELGRGDRLAVVGRNGAGKSSLLRCLAGVQQPTEGTVEMGANVELGYFAQDYEQVDLSLSAMENLDDTVLKTEGERRSLLGSFGLTGKTATQRASSLSGGERGKLGLAMLAAGRCNVLLLDEPTNNLDPASVESVGGMLGRWPGTIVVVSHDRAFIEAIEPNFCLALPAERYSHWREEDLDEVEMR